MKRKLSILLAIILTLLMAAATPASVLAATTWSENWDSYGVVWAEDWDSYATGQSMHGVDGWKGWDNDPSFTAYTSSSQYRSSPNSIAIAGSSDLVHEFAIDDGVWAFTAWQFVPSAFAGYSYFIMLNQYEDSGNKNWSVQVLINGAADLVTDDGGMGSLPLLRDQWVEIRVEIDLDTDWQKFYYGGDLLYQRSWSQGISGGGVTSIAALDLYANGSSAIYYDDLCIGQSVHGVNGWKGWNNDPSFTAFTSNSQYRSSPNSIAIAGSSDLVHEFAIDDGVWAFTAWQFVPSAFADQAYFIMLNQYQDSGPYNWSVQVLINGAADLVTDDGGMGSLPLLRDQWVEIRVEIDLDTDWQKFYYGGDLLYERSWSQGISGGGVTSIAALDLFANGSSTIYYDDLSLDAFQGPALDKSFCNAEIQVGYWNKGNWYGEEWISIADWHILNGGTGDEQWYPKNQRTRWPVTFSVHNDSGEDWTDVVLRDYFGAELELLYMEYELDGVTYEIDRVGISNLNKDPAVDENGIGFYTNRGASAQLRFIWKIGNLPAGESHTLTFYVATDLNPGQGKKDVPKWEFTSCGIHTLNSGANLQWIDGANAKHSESTEEWAIQVCKPTPVVTTEIQAPMIDGVAYILIENTVQDEATVHSLEGVRGVNCDWYPAATGDVAFQFSEDGVTWTSWGGPIDLGDGTVTSDPVDFDEVGRYYLRAVFESADNNYSDSSSGDFDEPLEVIQLSMVVEKTGDELSKIGDLVDYTITIENTSSGNVPPMFFDIVDSMLGINMVNVPIALGATLTLSEFDHEVPVDADDPYVNEVTVHATVQGLPYEIDGGASWETNLFQPSFEVTFDGDEVVGVGDEIEWVVRVENTSSADAPDAEYVVTNQFTLYEAMGTLASGEDTLVVFGYTAEEADRPQIEATLTVEITYDDFPNEFYFEETFITVINSPPVADFRIDYTPISHCDQPVYFDDYSTDPDGDPLDYWWDFGDGDTSTNPNPSHEYGAPGLYIVTLTVTDPYGASDSISKNVVVTNSPPEAEFRADPTYLSWCDVVYFDNHSYDADWCDFMNLDYEWDFGDGMGWSYDPNPAYSYSWPGIFTVTLTVTDSQGEWDTYQLNIEVYNDPPNADFSLIDATLGWCDQPVRVQNNSWDPDSCEGVGSFFPLYYEWDFDNDGVVDSNEFEPTWSYAWPGTYEVRLRVIDNHGSFDEYTRTVTITNEAPWADFWYSPANPLVGESVNFYNDSYDWDTCDILSYEWDFDDGSLSWDENPTHAFSSPGSYEVTLRATDQFGVSGYRTRTITVVDW